MKTFCITLLTLTSALLQPTCAAAQRAGFVNVEGADLGAKISAARSRAGRASGPYWVAYGFPVRPQVAVDIVIGDGQGAEFDVAAAGAVTGGVGEYETRNLGVFLLYEGSGATPSRVEIYNLDRKRDYEGRAVYWLGSAGANESLALLRDLLGRPASEALAQKLTMGVALHDDAQVGGLLESLARTAPSAAARGEAASWLGRTGGNLQTLSAIARNDSEHLDVRVEAVRAIGKSREPGSGGLLAELYDSLEAPALKSAVIASAGKNRQPEAVALLGRVAQNENNGGLRLQAQQSLDKVTGAKKERKRKSKGGSL
jgi:hypothetical protein